MISWIKKDLLTSSKFSYKIIEFTQTKSIMFKWGELHEEDDVISVISSCISCHFYVLWWSTLLSKTNASTNEKIS